MLKHGFRQMFLGMEQVSSLSRLLNLHRLLQQKESNQLKKENKMKKAFVSVGACFCALLGMLTACTQPAPTSQESGYKTMTVKKENRLLTNSYSAVVKGRQSVEIRPQVSGTITEICVKEGAKVHKGQVLFVIDQVPYKAALQTALANVKSAEAAVATARLTFDSKEELFKERVVSDFDRQTAQNSLLEAEASLAQAKANETNARNDLSYTVVRSPVDGVAGMSSYRVGALVNSSITTPLLTVSDDEEVYVYFSMTENQMLSLLRQYGSVDKSLAGMPKVSLQLSDGVKYAHEGVIDAISGTIDTGTGAVSLRAVFPNPEGMLRNGSTATLVLPYTKENALVVPQEATFEIQDKVYVYKVNESGKAESAQVTVFPLNNGQEYIVESGLQEGEVIVAEGAGLIQENTQILSLHTEK
ncbi:efflux RND transporter periplasmic adaptor subunit [Phocaeicola plebeius]|uniref:Efflux RND transporter periplasmic adaptor subunit n=3 Tax=Phocaeicola plebeius TaxID=310297 RepID=A0A3E4MW99_9BACT|nr:efflux RND transporter periplasmic adaptor subunit [Phocaeicola plebeius]RGK53945.1 efflux RND transporter periplasmic adaptor subunit [Phocaeicola plebeius]RGM42325.1 efflux RND transporter periplasmic adaptor subunit [Phocaeicola plebeius]RGQ74532.1 efflux RND transporter periplasmic adaptor subunit [Phocaeicola plebeius]RGQ95866.1 efflux RND transporter periplasmic adaptor subunit [Phocaeicola plebeius]